MRKIRITNEQYNRLFTNKQNINENILSPEVHQAVHDLIKQIWLNPSQTGLSPFFKQNGVTWGDIVSYLTSVGIVATIGGGMVKIKNYFKRKFSPDAQMASKEKEEEISKITDLIVKDPKAPWNQASSYNPDRFKPATSTSQAEKDSLMPYLDPDNTGTPFKAQTDEASNYPAGTENDPNSPWNQDSSDVEVSNAEPIFKGLIMNKEIAILQSKDGLFVFDYDNIPREQLPNPQYHLNVDDIADYVNQNIGSISSGVGADDFLHNQKDLVKIDDSLKAALIKLYGKSRELIKYLGTVTNSADTTGVAETTGAASSGAFTGALGGTPNQEEQPIAEMTSTAGSPQSSPSGQYTQPAIWAKNKANWRGAAKTQHPDGKMVNVKNSVASEAMYETIAKKTGKSVAEVKKIIETKLHNTKPLLKK